MQSTAKLLLRLALLGGLAAPGAVMAQPAAQPPAQQGGLDMGLLGNSLALTGIVPPGQQGPAGAAPAQPAPVSPQAALPGLPPSGPAAPAPVTPAPAPTQPPAATAAGPLRFNADPARRQAAINRMVQAARATNPAAGAEIERFFTSQDIFGVIERWMQPYGLRMDDIADVMAVRLAGAWMASRGRDDDPTPAQMTALRNQMAEAMQRIPALTNAGDAERQEVADLALIQAALISAAVTGAKNNPAQLRQIQQMAVNDIRGSMRIDLQAVELTDAGLRPRG
ncbi:DUF6683 family protein [Pseudoroseomonas cervicalis]|uniref:DUF6683 family protein n=1 Tax=Teichococcus cervicalis TaxID=204525 RepID=UPI00278475A4|nr:DUF6683 family protein [Pseudoroseomonas cervicalis]MDQ1078226.1 pyruvate/2-oxoglutarate dehydrogenase complex dihydrolipoamide acyltransferase (E2) component [Pseudoroseomonas cervicalis]